MRCGDRPVPEVLRHGRRDGAAERDSGRRQSRRVRTGRAGGGVHQRPGHRAVQEAGLRGHWDHAPGAKVSGWHLCGLPPDDEAPVTEKRRIRYGI